MEVEKLTQLDCQVLLISSKLYLAKVTSHYVNKEYYDTLK